MVLAAVTLDDKYALERGRVFLSGVQTLTRLLILQAQRDHVAGLKTAGFVTGYRGSPLGGLDRALTDAGRHLKAHDISFQPGVNEELAATSIWGTQQLHFLPQPKYDGVFAMWYGKGPGADRCGDVFKHANYAGTARHGGVLVVAGDDHGAKSSSIAHQSDHQFVAAGIPVLAPAGIQEFLDFGIHGWAMSRYSGLWVGFKITSEAAESSASVEVDPHRVRVRLPEDFDLPPEGISIRWPDDRFLQERRMAEYKVYAAQAYARTNGLDHIVWDGANPKPRLGIISCGKAYLDVRQALDDLGIDEREAARIGIRLYKVGLVWPLEAEGVRQFAQGLEEILVVEEKRQIIEYQLKEQLYNWRVDVRPRVIGKFDERGEWGRAHGSVLLPMTTELTPAIIARAIAARVARFHSSDRIRERLALLDAKEKALAQPRLRLLRPPFYCAGCPHNRSTKVPEGSSAFGGVGCHLMAVWMDRNTLTVSQMGGEGAAWIGLAAHTGTRHVFANMGDGTYFHSGLLAIRAAVAANVNITYKILYNDAVAMTGGQPMDGPLSVPQLTRQIESEGVRRIVVVTDEPEKYVRESGFAAGVVVRHRDDLEAMQRELRQVTGVTALIYDQTCAAEKRRRRKRGAYSDPARRVVINELVCEGCGDCSVKSNCLAVVPVETEFGRKRAIDQSACNKDYSCLDGMCPSFVTVEGGSVRKGKAAAPGAGGGTRALAPLPEPPRPPTTQPWDILVTGVGGTGVVTIGALLGMAAHLEGKGVSVVDMTGLAQKGGAVYSHVRIADRPDAIHSASIAAGEADAVIGCDLIATVAAEPIERMCPGVTRAVVNVSHAVTGDFIGNPDWQYPQAAMEDEVRGALGTGNAAFIEGTRLATSLMGDAIATNLFMLGFAYQKGLVPVGAEAILRAVELNGTAVEMNKTAFGWGRCAACDAAAVEAVSRPATAQSEHRRESRNLDEVIERRVRFLTDYQDEGYARRYRELVERTRRAEGAVTGGSSAPAEALTGTLTEAVARGYFRLLAYKDEYEVARLYTDGRFEEEVRTAFEGEFALNFHFAPPLFARIDPVSGEPRKRRFGPWVRPLLKLLARMKGLRGTSFDPFSYSAERRLDRALIAEYEATLAHLLGALDRDNHAIAVEIAVLAQRVRGFGPVRSRAAQETRARQAELLNDFGRCGHKAALAA
jgi:indolepyruvate ferredoxin oxidoreductase